MTALDTKIEPIRKEITVACDAETAFDVFARRISDWWPVAEHSVSAMNGAVARKVVLDLVPGGRLYEISHDGEEIDWGTVKSVEPGRRLVLNWHINKPAALATEVDVTFTPRDDGKTDVVLVHRNFEAMGEDGPSQRAGYNSGWVNVFEHHYARACAG